MSTELARTPDLAALIEVVLNTLPSKNSRRVYDMHLRGYLEWVQATGAAPGRLGVQQYARHLTDAGKRPSTVNLALSAVRKLYSEAAAHGWIDDAMAAAVDRIPNQRRLGQHAGNWLDADAMARMLALPDLTTVGGRRDSAVLHLLYACALRRSEVVGITVGHLQEREGRLCLVDMRGKGQRVRTVPVPQWAEGSLLWWQEYRRVADDAEDHEPYITALGGESLHDRTVYDIVNRYRIAAGIASTVGPHDLRRSNAKHQLKGGAPIEQISINLGHSSIATTQRYLGVDLDLERPACDFMPVPGAGK